MIDGFPHAEYPLGWFQIAWSPDVPPDQVVPIDYFGQRMICYRGESGAVHVMDAFCPHMGAHLAYGGMVEGDSVRCGFHGWCWGEDGRNTEIPYGARRSINISIRSYPTAEIDGLVFMWFDPAGQPPSWQPPSITEAYPGTKFFDIFPHCIGDDRLKFHPQMLVENTVDFPHLVWTHRWVDDNPELVRYEADGHHFLSHMRGLVPTPKGTTEVDVVHDIYGLGLVLARMEGIRDVLQVATMTPIDHDFTHVRMSTFVSCPEGADPSEPDNVALSIAKAQRREVINSGDFGDRKIWENQRYVARPPLVPEEAEGIRAVRRWAEQFYREPALT